MKRLNDGETIQVGDVIESKSVIGTRKFEVHRITKRYAFVRYNDVAEGKYPVIYNRFGFQPLPKARWNMVDYAVYRPE